MIKPQIVWNVISVYMAYTLYLLSRNDRERLVLVIVLIGFLIYLFWDFMNKQEKG